MLLKNLSADPRGLPSLCEGLRGALPGCPLGPRPSFLEAEVQPQREGLTPVSAPWWPLGSSEAIWAGGEGVPSDTRREGLVPGACAGHRLGPSDTLDSWSAAGGY